MIDRFVVGGAEKIAVEETRALLDSGEDAYLVVLRRQGLANDAFVDLRGGLPTIYLDDRLPRVLRTSFSFPVFHFFSFFHISYPLLIPWVLRRREFDHFIVHGTLTCFTATFIKFIRKIPYSVFVWDPISYIVGHAYQTALPRVALHVLRAAANYLDGVIIGNAHCILLGGSAHSRYIRSKAPQARVEIIPPGVHVLENLPNEKGDHILVVTAWKRGKNPEYLFDLLDSMPDLTIEMVGNWVEPKYKAEFESEVRRRAYGDRLRIIGGITEDELSRRYSRALVTLQITDDRGFGMPALESAARGTTFIIPRGQGVCDLFVDGVDGFYTKEKDTRDIVRLLNLLIKQKSTALKMGGHAWRTVTDRYSWRRHAKRLIEVTTS